jgi:ankyrin repeat protein
MRTLILAAMLLASCGYGTDTPLTLAARNGNVATVDSLIARGADPNAPSGVNDWTPLMHAVHKHQLATATALLAHGADPNRIAGQTALTMAAGYGDAKMVALLLAHGADPRLRDGKGHSPLDAALTGTADIDEPTLLRCQAESARLLMHAAPDVMPSAGAVVLAKLKRC